MRFTRRSRSSNVYLPPKAQAHRGFVYLDDDIVINSLSALESGKVDEVVEKINLAQERGLSVGAKVGADGAGASANATRKGSESLQAEVIRRRTRFSVFELWRDSLSKREAIGRFGGWGSTALEGVEAGQVVEMRGRVELVPLQVGFRMYLWFAAEVRAKNPLFKDTKVADIQEAEHLFKFLLGKRDEINATLTPQGDAGPIVAVRFLNEWLVESVGRWNGMYTIVAQVEEVLGEGVSWPTLRMIEDAPLSPLEKTTLAGAVSPFKDALKALGIDLDESSTEIHGPALILRPIAMYR